MKKDIKKFYLDVETTGLDFVNNNIHQIAGIITDSEDNILEKINIKFAPFEEPDKNISKEALVKCNLTLQEIRSREITYEMAFEKLINVLSKYVNVYDKTDKYQLVGYCINFDVEFLRNFFIKCNNEKSFYNWFYLPPLDMFSVSAWFLNDFRRGLPNMKLGTVCKVIGLEWTEEKSHDALYDIEKTLELNKYFTSIIKP